MASLLDDTRTLIGFFGIQPASPSLEICNMGHILTNRHVDSVGDAQVRQISILEPHDDQEIHLSRNEEIAPIHLEPSKCQSRDGAYEH